MKRISNLACLLNEAVSEAIANVSLESGCLDIHGVIDFDVSDGWINVKVTLHET